MADIVADIFCPP